MIESEWCSSIGRLRCVCEIAIAIFRVKCGHWSFTPKTPNIVCNKFNLINFEFILFRYTVTITN